MLILHTGISYIVADFHTITVSHYHCITAFFEIQMLCLCITHGYVHTLEMYQIR